MWCDPKCFNEDCNYDGGDCDIAAFYKRAHREPECAPGCDFFMLNNQICDEVCKVDKCVWDIYDCEGTETPETEDAVPSTKIFFAGERRGTHQSIEGEALSIQVGSGAIVDGLGFNSEGKIGGPGGHKFEVTAGPFVRVRGKVVKFSKYDSNIESLQFQTADGVWSQKFGSCPKCQVLEEFDFHQEGMTLQGINMWTDKYPSGMEFVFKPAAPTAPAAPDVDEIEQGFVYPTSNTHFETAVLLNSNGSAVVSDLGQDEFNSKFAQCPVVKYRRNDEDFAYYKRVTPLPDNFNAYNIFTDTWASTDNVLNTDFELYFSLDDLKQESNKWAFCNYDDPGVGFPRDCGPTSGVPSLWFSMPDTRHKIRGITDGASFEVCDADLFNNEAPSPKIFFAGERRGINESIEGEALSLQVNSGALLDGIGFNGEGKIGGTRGNKYEFTGGPFVRVRGKVVKTELYPSNINGLQFQTADGVWSRVFGDWTAYEVLEEFDFHQEGMTLQGINLWTDRYPSGAEFVFSAATGQEEEGN